MEDCPLCGRWDCECEDILTPEEYKRLVEEETKEVSNMENQVHLNAVGEITEMIYVSTHEEE